MVIIVCNYPADLNWPPLLHRDFLPFLSTLWQAITATETAMVITAPRRAQIPKPTPPGNHYGWERGRHNPHHSADAPTPTLAQTFRQLQHRPAPRHRARLSSLRLHLPRHLKSQRRNLFRAAANRISLPLLFFVPDFRSGLKVDSLNQSTLGLRQMRQIA
jgi:hypothetical protein